MKTNVNKAMITGLLLAAIATAAGCGGDDSISNAFGAAGKFRVVNGISDSTSINVSAPNVPSDLTNITVNTASGFRTVPPSTFNAVVTVNNSTGSQPTATLNNVQVSSGQETTAYFPGMISDNSFATPGGFAIQNGVGNISNGNTEVTFVNAASSVNTASNSNGTVNITYSANQTPLVALTYVNYRAATTPAQLAAGTYSIGVALNSAPNTTVFSSTLTLVAGARVQVAVLNETDTSKNSPIRLLVIPSDGSATTTLQNTQ